MIYALLLPNHEAVTYYRWQDLSAARKAAQSVANGWHEYVSIVELQNSMLKTIETVKPKGEIAKIPHYTVGGNRTWSMEFKQDTPERI